MTQRGRLSQPFFENEEWLLTSFVSFFHIVFHQSEEFLNPHSVCLHVLSEWTKLEKKNVCDIELTQTFWVQEKDPNGFNFDVDFVHNVFAMQTVNGKDQTYVDLHLYTGREGSYQGERKVECLIEKRWLKINSVFRKHLWVYSMQMFINIFLPLFMSGLSIFFFFFSSCTLQRKSIAWSYSLS